MIDVAAASLKSSSRRISWSSFRYCEEDALLWLWCDVDRQGYVLKPDFRPRGWCKGDCGIAKFRPSPSHGRGDEPCIMIDPLRLSTMYMKLRLPGGTMDKPSTLMMLQLINCCCPTVLLLGLNRQVMRVTDCQSGCILLSRFEVTGVSIHLWSRYDIRALCFLDY